MKAPKEIKLDMKLVHKILASYKRQDKRRKSC